MQTLLRFPLPEEERPSRFRIPAPSRSKTQLANTLPLFPSWTCVWTTQRNATQAKTTPMQDPFQPSSTPLGDARRYLCWNRVGTIISVDEVGACVGGLGGVNQPARRGAPC